MQESFAKGDLIDAQNMNAFVACLEGQTDDEYEHMAEEAELTDREHIGL